MNVSDDHRPCAQIGAILPIMVGPVAGEGDDAEYGAELPSRATDNSVRVRPSNGGSRTSS